eukprot:768464-Hanusia_phi.AAC.7
MWTILTVCTPCSLQLYVELSSVCKKVGSTRVGQEALHKGEIKELSLGFACLELNQEVLKLKGKIHLKLFGGVKFSRQEVTAAERKGFFSRFRKAKAEIVLSVSSLKGAFKALPNFLVSPTASLEALEQFSLLTMERQKEAQGAGKRLRCDLASSTVDAAGCPAVLP